MKAPLVPGRAEPRAVTVVTWAPGVPRAVTKDWWPRLATCQAVTASALLTGAEEKQRAACMCGTFSGPVPPLVHPSVCARLLLALAKPSGAPPSDGVRRASALLLLLLSPAPVPGSIGQATWLQTGCFLRQLTCRARRVLEVTMGGRKVPREPCAVLASLHVCVVCTVGCTECTAVLAFSVFCFLLCDALAVQVVPRPLQGSCC